VFGAIDYDQFTIPFEGTFDLIVANHMLTHIVRLDRFFNELRAHLRQVDTSISITSSTKHSSSRRASRSSTL
jgi:2-polyprenyl-3-methyl-5-hydroxy-6-metoxy-1,4-benzoquinol methylase